MAMRLKNPASTKIQVHSRVALDPLDIDPDLIRIEDIAHHLGNQCRFTGATDEFYSVGQHSVLCSHVVPKRHALNALMHDAAEYVLQDMSRPLKHDPRFGQPYRGAEARVQKAIANKFGFLYPDPPEVKIADALLFMAEVRDLMGGMSPIFGLWVEGKCDHPTIKPWSPRQSRKRFLARYHQLSRAVV